MTPINSEDKPTNSDYVALWQLQDIEETILDTSPDELPELHDKLVALSTGITDAVQNHIAQSVHEAKQAITSLIKELVAEAKPLYYVSPDKSEYQDGFNTCIRLYEQNLLKALEEN